MWNWHNGCICCWRRTYFARVCFARHVVRSPSLVVESMVILISCAGFYCFPVILILQFIFIFATEQQSRCLFKPHISFSILACCVYVGKVVSATKFCGTGGIGVIADWLNLPMVVLTIVNSTGITGKGKHCDSICLVPFFWKTVVFNGASRAAIAVTASKNWIFFVGFFSFLFCILPPNIVNSSSKIWYGSRCGEGVGSCYDSCCVGTCNGVAWRCFLATTATAAPVVAA